MNEHEKLRLVVLSGASDASIDVEALCRMLIHLGFDARAGKGSHRVFSHPACRDILTLQPAGRHAKPYQIRQVRATLAHLLDSPR